MQYRLTGFRPRTEGQASDDRSCSHTPCQTALGHIMKRLRNAPLPLHRTARPHIRRVVRITRRKAARRSDEKRSFGPNSAKRKKNRSYRIAPDRAQTDSAKRTNGIPTRRPDRSETHPAKSVLITSFALFGNILSKNPATLLIKHTSYEPKRLRSDDFKKTGHNLLIRRITKKSVYCRAKEDLRIIKHCFYEI